MPRSCLLTAPLIALAGFSCAPEVVRDVGGTQGGSSGSGDGGEEATRVDPAAECAALGLLMDQIEGCKQVWRDEPCATDLEFALEFGCLSETLAKLRCAAATCEDVEACRAESEAFGRCREELADSSG